jgi:hypothetical protein
MVETEETPENTTEYPDDPEPAAEGHIQMEEYSPDYLINPSIGIKLV